VNEVTAATLATHQFLRGMSGQHLAQLAQAASLVVIPPGRRLFENGGYARRFWLIRSGTVVLDLQVPGQGAAVIDTLGMGEVLGWSWLFPPHVWAFGAVAVHQVEAFEFDGRAVLARCDADPALGYELARRFLVVVARRLQAIRTRLLDRYAPCSVLCLPGRTSRWRGLSVVGRRAAAGQRGFRQAKQDLRAGEGNMMSSEPDRGERRIVVGVDGSPSSTAALRWAFRQAELTGAVVDAVAAWRLPSSYGWAPDTTGGTSFEDEARNGLTAAIAEVSGGDSAVEVRPKVVWGHPAQVLVDAAKGAELLVVGSRGHGGFVGALLGSVSQHCVHHAPCPVVIIRGMAAGEPGPGDLGNMSSLELHDLAVRRAIRHMDADFLWQLLRAMPAAESAGGHDEVAVADMTQVSALIADALRSGQGEIADALRPLYIDYLGKHGYP
jgi:nucleotide-binding universal stress UspA family protein/CRP-like cAMP-binding protein